MENTKDNQCWRRGGSLVPLVPVGVNVAETATLEVPQEIKTALAGVAQWTELQPANQRVASLIPSQGTCLGCRPGPQ